jgi:hypothetical protein
VLYGKMFYILQRNPRYLAKMTRHLEKVEIETFMQSVVLTLYGDQYDNVEERLLLQMFQMMLEDEFTDAHERMVRAGATEATTSPLKTGEGSRQHVCEETPRTHKESSAPTKVIPFNVLPHKKKRPHASSSLHAHSTSRSKTNKRSHNPNPHTVL